MNPSHTNSPATDRLVVVKLGGAEGVGHESALEDCAATIERGTRVLLVHGGSAEANRLGHDVGHPPRILVSPGGHESRHTDRRTLDLFTMATALVNRRIVGRLQSRGVRALGLSGLDGGLLRGERKPALRAVENGRVRVIRDDWSGRITSVDGDLCRDLLGLGLVPVVAPLAMTADGTPLNVDGDRVAAAIAGAVEADALVLLTGADGLYRSYPDPASRIEHASLDEYATLEACAEGRMKRKVLAARDALEAGVRRVMIATADGPAPLSAALRGSGTTLFGSSQPAASVGGAR